MKRPVPLVLWIAGINVVLTALILLSSLVLGKGNTVGIVAICIMSLLLGVFVTMAVFQNTKWLPLVMSWVVPGSKPVTLIDFEGDKYHTLATRAQDGAWQCPLYYFTNTGRCCLLDDGVVDPLSESSYVKYWIPIRQDERVMHQLANDVPDVELLKATALVRHNIVNFSKKAKAKITR